VLALEAQLSEVTAREATLREQLHSMQSELQASRAREESASTELQTMRDELFRVMAEAGDASQAAMVAREEAQRNQEALTDKVQRLTEELRSARDAALQAADSASTLAALQSQLQERDSELAASREAHAALERDLLRAGEEFAQLVARNAEAEGAVVRLTSDLESSRAEAAQAQAEIGRLTQEVSDLTESSRAEAERAQAEVGRLTQEVSDLTAAVAASSNDSSGALGALQAQLDTRSRELQAAEARRAALEAEVAALKEAATSSETMTKKLAAKLKLKMKECTDLTAEVEGLRESVNRNATAEESTKAASSQRTQQLESALAAQKADFEVRLKALNDSVIAGEEKVSTLLREKNKLQEELYATQHKAESLTKELHGAKTERDQARQQYLDVESKLQALSASSREKIDALTTKVAELDTANARFAAQLTAANETLALSNSEVTTLKENATALAQAKEKIKAHAAAIESLKQQLADTKTESEAKAEAANDRIKKLKALLVKVNAASQEKESKLTQFQSMNDRAKKFNIVTRIGVVPPQDPSGRALEWCLVYEHRPASAPGAKGEDSKEADLPAQYRWIEERVAHKWVAEGSTLVGSWPQPVQETWAHEISALRSRLESERDEFAAKLEDTTAQFQAYKVRAQTALKRIGTEDRNEKLKAQEAESAEIERLRSVIQDLKEREAEMLSQSNAKDRTAAELEQKIDGLRKQVEQLENSVQDSEQTLKVAERRSASLQKDIETLQEDNRAMKEQYEKADRTHREREHRMRTDEEAAAKRLVTKAQADAAALTAATASATSDVSVPALAAPSSGIAIDALDAAGRPTSPAAATATPTAHSAQATPSQRGLSRASSQSFTHPSPRGRPLAVEAALSADLHQDGSDNKFLLFQQVGFVCSSSY
jgi:chromosome segregation ATPase